MATRFLSLAAFSAAGLESQPGSHVAHVLVRQHGGEALHDGTGTLAGLELFQLLDQIGRVLLCQLGVSAMLELPSAAWQATQTVE